MKVFKRKDLSQHDGKEVNDMVQAKQELKESPVLDANPESGVEVKNAKDKQRSHEFEVIRNSNLFDLKHYEKQCGLSFESLDSAVTHYVEQGFEEGLAPSVVFDCSYYLRVNKDVAESGLNPLAHYIEFGGKELREPSPVFKTKYFMRQLTQEQREKAQQNPLVFYMNEPASARPHPLFDAGFYYSQLSVAVDHPFSHYLREGYKEGLEPHPLFNSRFFRENNETDDTKSPLAFYCELPENALVRVCPLFDPAYYVARHPDAASSGMDLLSHYVLVGSRNNYWPMPLFMAEYYAKQIGSEAQKFDSLLSHYVVRGEANGYSPCPWFDKDFYLDSYKFVSDDHRGPLAHYYYDGWRHDFMPCEEFSPRFLKSRYGIPEGVNPLQHYIASMAGVPMLPEKAWHDDVPEYRQLEVVREFFGNKNCENPKVSVVIPVYNNFSYTLRCLYSIAISKDKTPFEVIVADDLSSDETESELGKIEGIKYVRNLENLGFLRSCNNAATYADGEFLFLLNNDTAVLNGWLDNLVSTFDDYDNVGLVGSKLLYPNGLLQEAGGVLWEEGAANLGKFDDPLRPDFSYLRQVDYVSGAAIMIPMEIWNVVGGFDQRYVPAYCEDSDLCLQLRNMGYRVLMQPTSKVVHFEGISSGTDLNTGVKKYQVSNSEKLKEKWQSLLSKNGANGDFSRECVNRENGPRILIIDATIPTPDQDAGSVTVWYFLKIFRQLGYQVTFIPDNLYNISPYTEMVQGLGVECLFRPYLNDINQYIRENGNKFDVVMLYRVNCGGKYFETVRHFAPQAKLIFDTVDLHFLREERQAKMEKDKAKSAEMLQRAYETRDRELHLLRNSDISIVLSEYEKDMLSRDWGINNTFVIPIVLEVPGCKKTYAQRKDIAFVGGYQHTPNVDAVLYFVENLWPRIKEKLDGVKFYIIGSKPPAEILELQEQDEDIIVTGFVESLDPYMDELRLTVAPLRYGAGIKGKIGSSLSYGVPCIATKVAAEGMGLTNGKDILMSSEETTFVENLVSTYNNGEAWSELSRAGMEFVERNYSISAIRDRLLFLLNSVSAYPFVQKSPFNGKHVKMRLAKQPHTDHMLCEAFGSTSAHRMLAQSVIDLAREKGKHVETYLDAVRALSIDGIQVADVLDTDLHKYIGESTFGSDIESIDVGTVEFDISELNTQKALSDKLNQALSEVADTLLCVVKGESIPSEMRGKMLNWLFLFCKERGLVYQVAGQASCYSAQRHISVKMQKIKRA